MAQGPPCDQAPALGPTVRRRAVIEKHNCAAAPDISPQPDPSGQFSGRSFAGRHSGSRHPPSAQGKGRNRLSRAASMATQFFSSSAVRFSADFQATSILLQKEPRTKPRRAGFALGEEANSLADLRTKKTSEANATACMPYLVWPKPCLGRGAPLRQSPPRTTPFSSRSAGQAFAIFATGQSRSETCWSGTIGWKA